MYDTSRIMRETSLVRAIVEPEFLAAGGDAVVFADLFGVRTQSDIATRLRIALQTTLQKSFPLATLGKDVLRIAKNLRPSLSVDAMTGKTSLTLKDGGGAPSSRSADFPREASKKPLRLCSTTPFSTKKKTGSCSQIPCCTSTFDCFDSPVRAVTA